MIAAPLDEQITPGERPDARLKVLELSAQEFALRL